MKNLIPHFIQDQFESGASQGSLTGFAIFVDLSGFTRLTEKLLKEGKVGAEKLSDILNAIFSPMVALVYKHGGFIPHFAGDAYFGIFPEKNSHLTAEHIAAISFEHFQLLQKASSEFEGFDIKMKIGISHGRIEWGIVGFENKSFYFRGQAIMGCANSQSHAGSQEIIVDEYFKKQMKASNHLSAIADEGYYKLNPSDDLLELPKGKRPRRSTLSRAVSSRFLPEAIIQFNQRGEFRTVVSVFLSFEGLLDHHGLNEFASVVLEKVASFSGYFKEMEFADKGGVMVILFGAPVSFENNAERALEFLIALDEELIPLENASDLKRRAGIATGIAYTGIIGGDQRCQYAAVGNRVNIAARIMMKAKWGEILTDETVQKNRHFIFEHKGDISYKGMQKQIPTYKLIGKNEEYRQAFSGVMVGRSKEMKQLTGLAVNAAESSIPAIAYVYGEAGIGKTRLAYELQNQLRKKTRLRWVTCQSDEILRKPFNPFVYFLKIYFDQLSDNTQEVNLENFERRFAMLVNEIMYAEDKGAAQIKREVIRTKPVLAALTSLRTTNTLWDNLDAKGRYENTLAALSSLFKAEALLRPLVIELEDGHWFDQSSKEFLNDFIGQIKGFPIFFLVTSRYDDEGNKPLVFDEKLLKSNNVKSIQIDLNILDRSALEEFAKVQLGGGVTEGFIELLNKATNGNPFYAEQIIEYFLESGQLEQRDGLWTVKDENVRISDSIQAILTARIDRLSEMVKETVKAAAVIGREFELPVLNEIMKTSATFTPRDGNGQTVLKEQVKTAERAQIWQAVNELRYIFRHALLREAVYDMQLKTRLRKLHRSIAEAIENLYKGGLEEHYVDLVFHYEQAEVTPKLKYYLLKAADYAKEYYQNQQAVRYYDRLLKLLESDSGKEPKKNKQRADILLKKGNILELTGEWEEAEKLYRDALALARRTEDSGLLGSANNQLGYLLMLKGNYEEADSFLETAAAFFGSLHDNRGTSKVYGNLGTLYFRQGKYEDAKLYFIRSIQLAQLYKHTSSNAQIVATLGLTYMNLGKYDDGIRWQQSQLDLCKKVNDRQGMATLYVNMGIVYFEKGDMDNALNCYEQGLELSEELGNKQLTAIAIGSIGNVWQRKGNFEMAMQNFQRDLVLVEELGDKQGIAIANGLIGELYSMMGEFDKAIEFLQRNLTISIELSYRKGVAKALNSLADIYYFKEDYYNSIDYYDRCITVTRNIGNKLVLGYSLIEKGIVLAAMNKMEKALKNQKEASSIAKELNHPELLFDAKLLAAKINIAENKIKEATKLLKELLAEKPQGKDEASVLFEFSKIDESYREKALSKYKELYDRTPMHVFKSRIRELIGEL
ncbi:MAG: tetratricopeptide repeat protein [Bacteroidota bacterium]